MGFNLGNSIKYISRADLTGDAIEDRTERYMARDRPDGCAGPAVLARDFPEKGSWDAQ